MATIERIGRLKGPLTLRCFECGHTATWQPKEAERRLGGQCSVYMAREVLRCSNCGAKRVEFSS